MFWMLTDGLLNCEKPSAMDFIVLGRVSDLGAC